MGFVETVLCVVVGLGVTVQGLRFVRNRRAIEAELTSTDCSLCGGKTAVEADGRTRCEDCGRDGSSEASPALAAQIQQLREVCAARRCVAAAGRSFAASDRDEANRHLAEAGGHLRDVMRAQPRLAAEVADADAMPATGANLVLPAHAFGLGAAAVASLGVLIKATVDGATREQPDFRAQLATWDASLAELRRALAAGVRRARLART